MKKLLKFILFCVFFVFTLNFVFSANLTYDTNGFTNNIEKVNGYDYIYYVYFGNDKYGLSKNAYKEEEISILNSLSEEVSINLEVQNFYLGEEETINTIEVSSPLSILGGEESSFIFKYNLSGANLNTGSYSGEVVVEDSENPPNIELLNISFVIDSLTQSFEVEESSYSSNLLVNEDDGDDSLVTFRVRKGEDILANSSGSYEFNVTNTGEDTLDFDIYLSDFYDINGNSLVFNSKALIGNQILELSNNTSALTNFSFDVSSENSFGTYFGNVTFVNSFNTSQNITKNFAISFEEAFPEFVITDELFEENPSQDNEYEFEYSSEIYEIGDVNYITKSSFYQVVTIENTGIVDLDITIDNTNFVNENSDEIQITLDKTSLEVLAQEKESFTFSFFPNSETPLGNYTAQVILNYLGEDYVFDLKFVLTELLVGELTYLGDQISIEANEGDDNVPFSFTIQNIGDEEIADIQVTSNSLVGSRYGYTIPSNDFDFEFSDSSIGVSGSRTISGEVDIDNDLIEDYYVGTILVSSEYSNVEVPINISILSDDYDINIDDNSFFESNNYFSMIINSKNLISQISFTIENEGNIPLENLTFDLEDLVHSSGEVIDSSNFIFNTNSFSLGVDSRKEIKIENENIEANNFGNYYGNLYIRNDNDIIEIYVFRFSYNGDIFIEEVDYDDETSPNEIFDVVVKVSNVGFREYDNIVVSGEIIQEGDEKVTIEDSTSSFSLIPEEEKEITLNFDIPEEVYGGAYNFKTTMKYTIGDEEFEIFDFFNFDIIKNVDEINVYELQLNKDVFTCENNLYSSFKIKNDGKNDNEVYVISSIYKKDNSAQKTRTFNLESLEEASFTFKHDIGLYETGDYEYSIQVFSKDENKNFLSSRKEFEIKDCYTQNPTPNRVDSLEEIEGNFLQNTNLTTYLLVGAGFILFALVMILFFL